MIHRTDDHLPWRWLADRHDGQLAGDRAAEAEAHLATGCAPCRARAESVRRLVAAIAAGPYERPPAAADRRVIEQFGRVAARRAAASADVLVGTLVLDRRADAALALRSAGDDTRRLLWTVGPYEVDASVVARGERADLLGQVVPAGDAPETELSGEVRAVRGRRAAAASPIERDGRFTFRALEPGPYVLEGAVDGRAFVLPLLVIGG